MRYFVFTLSTLKQWTTTCRNKDHTNAVFASDDAIVWTVPIVMDTQCKNSWNSCQDLAYSYIFPFTLETLDKILFILASHKPLGFLNSILGKSLIESVKRMNEFMNEWKL